MTSIPRYSDNKYMSTLIQRLQKLTMVSALLLPAIFTPIYTAPPAAAATLIDNTITDPQGFLSDADTQQLQEKLSEAQKTGIPIYIALVPEFADAPTKWCVESAQQSALPDTAIVYALAYEERKYATCHGNNAHYTNEQISHASSEAVEELKPNPLTSPAVAAAATSFTQTLINTSDPTPNKQTDSPKTPALTSNSLTSNLLDFLAPLTLFTLPLLGLIIYLRKKRPQIPAINTKTKPLDQILKETASLLMSTDNSVRSAADDLAFAQAQFGQLETQDFATALTQAQQLMSQAFITYQQLTNTTENPQKHQLAQQVQQLCQQANQTIKNSVARFNQLRNANANLPQTIRQLHEQISEAKSKNEQVKTELESLRISYSDTQLQSLFDNPANITALLQAASTSLESAQQALELHTNAGQQQAQHQVSLAQRTFGQAIGQINEVLYASQDLANAPTRLAQALASIAADLQDVQRLPVNSAAFSGMITNAERAIAQANQALAGNGDVLQSLTDLRISEDVLDAALAPYRANAAQQERNQQRFNALDTDVTTIIRQVDAYITSHRGAVQEPARASLATAKQVREQAAQQFANLQQSNPANSEKMEATLQLLHQAKGHAQQALHQATRESNYRQNNGFNQHQTGRLGQGSASPQFGGIDLGSLILGGIIEATRNSHTSYRDRDSYRDQNSDRTDSDSWGLGGGFFGDTGFFGSSQGFSGGSFGGSSGGWSSSSSGSF